MPIDLLGITTVFSGAQLAVIVFVLMELKAVHSSNKDIKDQNIKRDAQITTIAQRVAYITGRMKLDDVDSEH